MSATDANTKEQLVKNVKAWIQMDNEIKEFQKEIKVRFNWCQKFCLFYVFVSVTYSNYIFYNEFYLFFFFFHRRILHQWMHRMHHRMQSRF